MARLKSVSLQPAPSSGVSVPLPLSSPVHRNQPPNLVLIQHQHRRALCRDRSVLGYKPQCSSAVRRKIRPWDHRRGMGENPSTGRRGWRPGNQRTQLQPGRLWGAACGGRSRGHFGEPRSVRPGVTSAVAAAAPIVGPSSWALGWRQRSLRFEILEVPVVWCRFVNRENTREQIAFPGFLKVPAWKRPWDDSSQGRENLL